MNKQYHAFWKSNNLNTWKSIWVLFLEHTVFYLGVQFIFIFTLQMSKSMSISWSGRVRVFVHSQARRRIIQHYKEHHGHLQRSSDFSVFMRTVWAHLKKKKCKLRCDLCTFSEPSDITKYYAHLKTHLRNRETVKCPFADCSFKSSILSTLTAHRSSYLSLLP